MGEVLARDPHSQSVLEQDRIQQSMPWRLPHCPQTSSLSWRSLAALWPAECMRAHPAPSLLHSTPSLFSHHCNTLLSVLHAFFICFTSGPLHSHSLCLEASFPGPSCGQHLTKVSLSSSERSLPSPLTWSSTSTALGLASTSPFIFLLVPVTIRFLFSCVLPASLNGDAGSWGRVRF